MAGYSNAINASPTYDEKNFESHFVNPGGLAFPVVFKNKTGEIFMYSGQEFVPNGYRLHEHILKFNPENAYWSWIGGSNKWGLNPNYGTINVASESNNPGARANSFATVDPNGKLWLYGGLGGDYQSRNDFWTYSTPVVVTGISSEFETDERCVFYPNPTSGEFSILLNNETGNERVVISNSLGNLILQENIQSGTQNFSLSPGMYVVEVWRNNKIYKREKMIVN